MDNRFFLGTRKGLFIFENENGAWKQTHEEFLGVKVPAVLPDPRDGTIYAAVDHGHFGSKLHRSSDGGKTWDELEPPVYPEKPEDAPEIKDPFRQVVVPWSLEMIWSLEAGGPDQPGTLWCGTIPGGLFRSDDRGDTWNINEPLWNLPDRAKWMGGGYDFPGIHSICVHPEDSNRVAIGISCGGVWLTTDGGEIWRQGAQGMFFDFLPEDQGGADPDGQDPHRMVQCKSSPDRFWVQHHCGIYLSDTGGDGWKVIENVSPSGFGFAVAVHPDDPDTAWFAPAKKDEYRYPVDGKIVVNRTRDGGKSFEPLSDGFPDPPAYDLIYRHCLEVDSTGNRLVMGSTTGSLWSSDNQGDSWAEISANLPPIFTIRLG